WWLDLDGGWRQLARAWRGPRRAAGAADALAPASLTVLADHLARDGITDRALDLHLEAGEADRAADAATALAGDLAVWGCWPAVSRLGERLAGRAPAAGSWGAGPGIVRPTRRGRRARPPGRRGPR